MKKDYIVKRRFYFLDNKVINIEDILIIKKYLKKEVKQKKIYVEDNYFKKNKDITNNIDLKDAGFEMSKDFNKIYHFVIKSICLISVTAFTFIIMPFQYACGLNIYILFLCFKAI